MRCYISNEEKWQDWDKFNSKYGNVFQSSAFAKAYKDSGMKVQLLIVKDKEEIVAGTFYIIPQVKLNKLFNQLRLVSGPVLKDIKNKEALDILLDKLIETAKKDKSIISMHIRTPFVGQKDLLKEKGFKIYEDSPTHSFVIKLDQPLEQLWRNMSKTQRKKVNRCKRNKITIIEAKTEEDIKEFNKVYQEFAKKIADWIPIPYELFKGIYKEMKNNARFCLAKYQGKTIAVGLFLLFNNKIIYLANGSDTKHKDLSANTLLIWNIIEFVHKNNYKLLDIYGVKPNPHENDKIAQGMYFFKSQFGGELKEVFMYAGKNIAPVRHIIFYRIIIPLVLPIYKRITLMKNKVFG